ncbi:hypothetical protein JB92DRAFT_3137240 [Gautieria morchelliformis]|nr:hypothetical protein JB92DRAFT_3137240 [Gautieria morchelliformis]
MSDSVDVGSDESRMMIDHNKVMQTPETTDNTSPGDSDGDEVPISMDDSANNTVPPVDAHEHKEIPRVPVGSSNVIEVDEPARSVEGSTIEPNPTPALPALLPLASPQEVTPVAPLDQLTHEHAEGDRLPVPVDHMTELPMFLSNLAM